jgi:ATP/maltotriose-dependent transcriptional regulator MalT
MISCAEAGIVGFVTRDASVEDPVRIALATVKNHAQNILEKLQVSRRSAAAAILRGAVSGKRRTILPTTTGP